MTDTDPAECALAYALWDAVHSVRLERPEDIDRQIELARDVIRWLAVHGYGLRQRQKEEG